MSKASTLNFEVTTLLDQAAAQFRNLNTKEPGQWPALPKAAAWLAMGAAVVVAGWLALQRRALIDVSRLTLLASHQPFAQGPAAPIDVSRFTFHCSPASRPDVQTPAFPPQISQKTSIDIALTGEQSARPSGRAGEPDHD